ncbi:MAG: aspartate/glutamate racemase family protein, partial [Rhodospirillales bacterium]|nr:aspartate/glutamate racemase family protein [Rhodospirillales bacterium]
IKVINPNSTESMTAKIRRCAISVAASGTEVEVVSAQGGPASIEGHVDGAMSVPGLLAEIRKGEDEGFDGYVVACFDDTGLDACRELARGPVIGICEAAMHAASMIASSFSVVTTLSRSVPIIEELALRYGMSRKCRRVRASDLPVLALEEPGGRARETLLAEIRKAADEDKCEAVVLGCAGMTDLTEWLGEQSGLPVIDGVVCAVKLVEALVGAGLATSKVCAYAPPRVKVPCR